MLDCHRRDIAGQGSLQQCIHVVCADHEFSQQQLDLLWRLTPDYPSSLKQVDYSSTSVQFLNFDTISCIVMLIGDKCLLIL
jgi:hypothetical protein